MSTPSKPLPQGPVLEAQTQRFLDALAAQGGPPIYQLSYADARQVLENAQAGVSGLPADTEDRVLPTGPTGEVAVRIYRPKGAQGVLPVVMYLHGGGWVLGSKNTHDRLLRDMVNATGAAFVFVSYTPSPEAQFPTSLEQCYAATKYVAEHGKELRLDGGRLAVMGDSAALSALLPRRVSTNGAPRKIHRKHGVNVTHVASSPPSVPAIIGDRPPGSRNAAMKPTNCKTMISGPGVVSAMPRPSSISPGLSQW